MIQKRIKKKKYGLEQILNQVKSNGPRVIRDLGIMLSIETAESLSFSLRNEGFEIDPFDFPYTFNVWKSKNADGVYYKHIATKQMINTLATKKNVDYRTFEGFKKVLEDLTEHSFISIPINKWGTTLGGMFQHAYHASPSAAVLDLVQADPEFKEIAAKNLQPYDFPTARINEWTTKDGKPTQSARSATKELIKALVAKKNVDFRTFKGFKQILSDLVLENFHKMPINCWETTLGGMVMSAYHDSPSAAVLDVVYSDTEFEEIAERNLQPYDFPQSPKNTWVTKSGKPTQTARNATKELIKVLALKKNVNYATFEGFKDLLRELTQDAFSNTKINAWETTLQGMLLHAYDSSPSAAVLDLVYSDPEFSEIADKNLQAYDFCPVPMNTWVTKNGRPTQIARSATKELIKMLALKKNVNYATFEGFKSLLEELTLENFQNTQINDWGTRPIGMLQYAYRSSPSAAVLDVVYSDTEFEEIAERNLQPYDFPQSPKNTWVTKSGKPTQTARNATKELIRALAARKNIDYRTFKGFKQILEDITAVAFRKTHINSWESTAWGALNSAYGNSTTAAVLDVIKKDDDFRQIRKLVTKDLLSGPRKSRFDRAEGNYSTHILRKNLKEQGLHLSKYGYYSFANGEKQTVRELLASEAKVHFGDKPIAYFGLEGPTFGSFFSLAQKLEIDTRQSLIPERDRRAYNIMMRIKNLRKVNDMLNGSPLSAIELKLQTAEKALAATNKKFDLIFLDWLGYISQAGIREMDLADQHLNKGGMIAITVNMSPMAQARYYRNTRLAISQDTYIRRWAQENGLLLQDIAYTGGDKRRTSMQLYILKR